MRIAYISTIKSASWGGSEELWYASANQALRLGYEVGLFTYSWPEKPVQITTLLDSGAKQFCRQRGIGLRQRLLKKGLHFLGVGLPDALNPFANLIRFRPDHVVVTDGAMYYAADDFWLRKTLLLHFTGKFVIICQGNSAYHFPSNRSETIYFFQKAQAIVFVAEKNRTQTFHQLAHSLERTSIVQNPVNLSNFAAMPFNDGPEKSIHFAVVGRLSVGEKGQDILVSLFATQFWRKANVCLHIYGHGRDSGYLADLISYYGVGESVSLEGHKSPEEIWERCQVLLMPSISEGTPLTLLEAMILGRVCIVTDVGGNAEWIADGVNGYLVQAPTTEMFEQKMREAIQNRNLWPGLAAAAHQSAMKKLDRNPGKTLLERVTSSVL